VKTEIADPLGLDGCYIGLPPSERYRIAALPALKAESGFARAGAKAMDPITRLLGFSPARFAAAFFPPDGYRVISTPEFLAAEVSGINGCFTARSLAKLYATLGSR